MELHRKVSSLIEFLKQKWTLHEARVVSFLLSAICTQGWQKNPPMPLCPGFVVCIHPFPTLFSCVTLAALLVLCVPC